MARVIQRHWKSMLLQIFLLTIVIFFALRETSLLPNKTQKMTRSAAAAQPPTTSSSSTGIDLNTYSRVQRLRRKLALTTRDLAAAGCTQNQATAVLTSLLNWTTANSAAWDQQENARRLAHQARDQVVRSINIGPRDPAVLSSLSQLQQATAIADQQYEAFFQGALTAVSGQLSTTQQQTIARAHANMALGVPDVYRYASGLTAAQASSIHLAMYRARGAIPPSAAGVSQSDISLTEATIQQYSPGVSAAESAVLPPPPSK